MQNTFQSNNNINSFYYLKCFLFRVLSLFETVQTLFWGFFGMVEKDRLDSLYRKHTFTIFFLFESLQDQNYGCLILKKDQHFQLHLI